MAARRDRASHVSKDTSVFPPAGVEASSAPAGCGRRSVAVRLPSGTNALAPQDRTPAPTRWAPVSASICSSRGRYMSLGCKGTPCHGQGKRRDRSDESFLYWRPLGVGPPLPQHTPGACPSPRHPCAVAARASHGAPSLKWRDRGACHRCGRPRSVQPYRTSDPYGCPAGPSGDQGRGLGGEAVRQGGPNRRAAKQLGRLPADWRATPLGSRTQRARARSASSGKLVSPCARSRPSRRVMGFLLGRSSVYGIDSPPACTSGVPGGQPGTAGCGDRSVSHTLAS